MTDGQQLVEICTLCKWRTPDKESAPGLGEAAPPCAVAFPCAGAQFACSPYTLLLPQWPRLQGPGAV